MGLLLAFNDSVDDESLSNPLIRNTVGVTAPTALEGILPSLLASNRNSGFRIIYDLLLY